MVRLAAIPYPTRSPGPGSFAHILLPDRSCSSGGSMLFLTVPLVIVGWHEEKKLFPYSCKPGLTVQWGRNNRHVKKTRQVQRVFGTFCLNKALINEQSHFYTLRDDFGGLIRPLHSKIIYNWGTYSFLHFNLRMLLFLTPWICPAEPTGLTGSNFLLAFVWVLPKYYWRDTSALEGKKKYLI